MQSEKDRRRLEASAVSDRRLKLVHLRELVLDESHPEEQQYLSDLEWELRENERREAIAWRRRSRVRWLSVGEAPTKYFFAQVKAKHARDTIQALKIDELTVTEDEALVTTVQTTFTGVFAVDPKLQNHVAECQSILAELDKRVSLEDNNRLTALPSREAIRKVVFAFPRNKSPGLDGLTAETLQGCWEFIGQDCCNLVQSYWSSGKLSKQIAAAVIKLLYKGVDRTLLKNWRPILLLNCPYKIIAKILANRLKDLLPELVDHQQTGFVQGRHVQDNVMTLRMVQERVQHSKTPIAMLQLDLQKAYDRVDHEFMWALLAAYGFSPGLLLWSKDL